MGTVDEIGHTEEPKDESQERSGTPVAAAVPPAMPAAPARQGDPFGASRTSEEFEPSVNNREKWVSPNKR